MLVNPAKRLLSMKKLPKIMKISTLWTILGCAKTPLVHHDKVAYFLKSMCLISNESFYEGEFQTEGLLEILKVDNLDWVAQAYDETIERIVLINTVTMH